MELPGNALSALHRRSKSRSVLQYNIVNITNSGHAPNVGLVHRCWPVLKGAHPAYMQACQDVLSDDILSQICSWFWPPSSPTNPGRKSLTHTESQAPKALLIMTICRPLSGCDLDWPPLFLRQATCGATSNELIEPLQLHNHRIIASRLLTILQASSSVS